MLVMDTIEKLLYEQYLRGSGIYSLYEAGLGAHQQINCLGFALNVHTMNLTVINHYCEESYENIYLVNVGSGGLVYAPESYINYNPYCNNNGKSITLQYCGAEYLVEIRYKRVKDYLLIDKIFSNLEGLEKNTCTILCIYETYKLLTGARMASVEQVYESIEHLYKLDRSMYSPVTESYLTVLEEIGKSYISDESVCINPKYDGMACWLYLSPNCPLSLLYQVKIKGGVKHHYVGRLTDKICPKLTRGYSLLVERMEDNRLVITDCFYDIKEDYFSRIRKAETILSLLKKINVCDSITLYTKYTLQMTEYALVRPGKIKSKVLRYSPTSAMSGNVKHTDGYVIYIGSRRPYKIKTAQDITVDLEYRKDLYDAYSGKWLVDNSELTKKLANPNIEMLAEASSNTVVLEVKVHDGTIVKVRPDRISGNPDKIIDNIIKVYSRDSKNFLTSFWTNMDIEFYIYINRTFKSYIHYKYVKDNSKIIDLGSGNGGDLHIWTHRKYKVLALEPDEKRFQVLEERTKEHSDIIVHKLDMRYCKGVLIDSLYKYKVASFMRSLSHLDKVEIRRLLENLISSEIETIVIITMVQDYVEGLSNTKYRHRGTFFNISLDNTINRVLVEYKFDDKLVSYEDNCYNLLDWKQILKFDNYNLSIELEEDYVINAYNIIPDHAGFICYTDVAFILQKNIF